MSFSGKTVIVTGSSNGIGKAAVLDFAKEGANVVVHGVNEQRLEVRKVLLYYKIYIVIVKKNLTFLCKFLEIKFLNFLCKLILASCQRT